MSNETKTRPTHRIYAVTGKGEKKFWQPIGALFAHRDGKGFNQVLDYLPLNDAQIVIRAVEEQPEAGEVPTSVEQVRAEILAEAAE